MLDEERTLGGRVGITTVPDRPGESVGVGKAKGFHRNPLLEVQPNNGLIVTHVPKLKTHGIIDL